jgi:hypothetical protein
MWRGLLQLVTQEQIDAARAGLSSKAAGDAEAAYEAAKARVGEARRAELEAQLLAAAEAAAAAAAEAEVRLARLSLHEASCMTDGHHTVNVVEPTQICSCDRFGNWPAYRSRGLTRTSMSCFVPDIQT